MGLNLSETNLDAARSRTLGAYGAGRSLRPGLWVQLLEPPHPLSDDEALLLCQDAGDVWSVWIPNYGEARLSSEQFYVVS